MEALNWLGTVVISEDTSAVLTAIFPIVLLTVVLERRAIHVNIRRQPWFRWATQIIVGACALGLPLAVLGVQFGGLTVFLGTIAWVACAVVALGLPFTLLAALATAEAEEDGQGAEGGE